MFIKYKSGLGSSDCMILMCSLTLALAEAPATGLIVFWNNTNAITMITLGEKISSSYVKKKLILMFKIVLHHRVNACHMGNNYGYLVMISS